MTARLPTVAGAARRASSRVRRLGRRPLLVLQLLVAAAVLVLLVRAVDAGDVVATVRAASPGWLLAAMGMATVSQLLSMLAWGALLPRGSGLGSRSLSATCLRATFLGQVLPGGAGDVVRIAEVGRRVGWLEAGVATALAHLASIAAMAVCAVVAVWTLPGPGPRAAASLGAVVLTGLVVLALHLDRATRRLPVRVRAIRPLARVAAGFGSYRRRRRALLAAVGVSLAAWVAALLSISLFAMSIHGSVPWTSSAVAIPVSLAASMLPMTANGLGVREGVLVGLLINAGVAQVPAAAVAVFVDVQALPLVAAGGALLAWRWLGPAVRRLVLRHRAAVPALPGTVTLRPQRTPGRALAGVAAVIVPAVLVAASVTANTTPPVGATAVVTGALATAASPAHRDGHHHAWDARPRREAHVTG